nr:YdeI/OmpD-associated family protein [Pedobacter sp. PACM 27299]
MAEVPAAKQHFENFSYSQKKEYLEWITEAKSEDTRQKRLSTALEWISEGKSRNWKYKR